jgi:hypothetical protein
MACYHNLPSCLLDNEACGGQTIDANNCLGLVLERVWAMVLVLVSAMVPPIPSVPVWATVSVQVLVLVSECLDSTSLDNPPWLSRMECFPKLLSCLQDNEVCYSCTLESNM